MREGELHHNEYFSKKGGNELTSDPLAQSQPLRLVRRPSITLVTDVKKRKLPIVCEESEKLCSTSHHTRKFSVVLTSLSLVTFALAAVSLSLSVTT